MPSQTSDQQIPYPLSTDVPDGATQMRQLAERVDDLISDIYTKVPGSKVKWGYTLLTVSGSQGEGLLAHGAGFIPTHVILTPRSGSRAVALTVDTDGATTANVRVRAYNVDNGSPLPDNSEVGVYYTVRA